MKTYSFAPNSPEWHAHRASGFFNASDAPAMMGCKGAYSTRDQLLHDYKYRIPKEVSEQLQRKFDDGHRFEALARPLAEAIIGDDLYPIIGTDGNLSASFDGLTMDYKKGWEHKSINNEIRDAFLNSAYKQVQLPEKYQVQMQHQMLVSDADSTLFSATDWDGDLCKEEFHCWFESDPELAARIVSGWNQFKRDLDAMPELEVIKDTQMTVIGRAPDALPVLRIRLAGLVTLTENNVSEYRETVRAMLKETNIKPVSDQDFADSEKRVKFAGKAEDDLLNAENALLSETGSVASVISDLRAMRSEFREFRLSQEKYLSARKDVVRSEIVGAGIRAFAEFKADLFDACETNWPLQSRFVAPEIATNFPGCIKNLRTIESMQNAVNTELAQAKIAARAMFETIDENMAIAWELNRHNLWPDLLTLVRKPRDDFHAILTGRIDKADKAEAERIAKAVKAEADRIAKEAKDAEAAALAAKEYAEARAEKLARVDREQQVALVAKFGPIDDVAESEQCSGLCEPDCPSSAITVSASPVLATPENTINIGQINARIDVLEGLRVNRVFLEQLGFKGVAVRSLRKYLDADFPKIVAAIIEHLRGVK